MVGVGLYLPFASLFAAVAAEDVLVVFEIVMFVLVEMGLGHLGFDFF